MEPVARHSRQGDADARRQPQGGFLPCHDLHDQQPGRLGDERNIKNPKLGFQTQQARENATSGQMDEKTTGKLARTGLEAARRKFTPEFMNRLDKIVTFQPLGSEQLKKILTSN